MASDVDIANRALSILGEARITALTDSNKAARAMNARFSMLRDAELAAYPWRFAIKRVQLTVDTATPAWGYSNIYLRPSDDLQPRRIGGAVINAEAIGVMYESSGIPVDNTPYEFIGNEIHTNLSSPLDYEYTGQITDTTEFHPLFVEALAARLASDAAEELTQSNTKQQAALFVYKKALTEARRVNAIMRPPRTRNAGRWMSSRIIG